MSAEWSPKCFSCGKPLSLAPGVVGRDEICPHCRADVRVCRNCRHFDQSAYNQCTEPMAERVVDKDRRNFCDYFSMQGHGTAKAAQTKEDAFKKLDALFKK
jgi:hypothetical protein